MRLWNYNNNNIQSTTTSNNLSFLALTSISSKTNLSSNSEDTSILSGSLTQRNNTKVLLYETYFNISFNQDRLSKLATITKKLLVEIY